MSNMRKKSVIFNIAILSIFLFIAIYRLRTEYTIPMEDTSLSYDERVVLALILPFISPDVINFFIVAGSVIIFVAAFIPAVTLDVVAYMTKSKVASVFFYIFFIVGGFILSCFVSVWGFLIILGLFAFRIYANKKEIVPKERHE